MKGEGEETSGGEELARAAGDILRCRFEVGGPDTQLCRKREVQLASIGGRKEG